MAAGDSDPGWAGRLLQWGETVSLRLTPLLVLLTLFGCVILTVKWLRPTPPTSSTPTVIVLGPDAPQGVERKVFAADSLFEFNSSTLNEKSEREVEDFAARLKADGVEQIIVVGHTDRIGTNAANNGLSQARANAVRAAILKSGISADSVFAIGIGNRMPVTARDECPGTQRDAATIACLSKDRRVEVWTKAATARPVDEAASAGTR